MVSLDSTNEPVILPAPRTDSAKTRHLQDSGGGPGRRDDARGGHYIAIPCRTRSTGPCECSATARPPSHSPTNRQTYKPDEGVAFTNEQRVHPYIMMNE